MSEEIICPDCGGVIGGEPGARRQPCRCFEQKRTVATDIRPMIGTDAPAVGEKVCRVCGKNLKGHRRLKDSRGYMCVACSEAEEKAEEGENLIPCPECGRKLKIDGITTYDGKVMCKRCMAEKKELNKYKPQLLTLETKSKEAEKQTLRNLLIVAGVLGLIMVLAYFGVIGK